jgi:hypothetical protein
LTENELSSPAAGDPFVLLSKKATEELREGNNQLCKNGENGSDDDSGIAANIVENNAEAKLASPRSQESPLAFTNYY